MSEQALGFAMLVGLAQEKSSEKRRELLRQVTDSFLFAAEIRSDHEVALFDEVAGAIATDLNVQVRAELANKVAHSRLPVRRTALRLALDVIEVAKPVLESSSALSQADLVAVVQRTSQDHMMAVTRRSDIGESVSGALVAKGGDSVVASLLQNESAKISRETYARVAERAQTNILLHAPLVRRQNVPLDVLNAVYHRVAPELRREIVAKFAHATDAEIDSLMDDARDQIASAYGALPRDYQLAKEHVAEVVRRGALQPVALERMLRDNQRTSFLIAFARLVGVDYELASRLVESKDLDAIAMLCRGANFSLPVFTTLCVLILGGSSGVKRAQLYGHMYEQVTIETAQRAIRFWKVRAGANREAA